MLRHKWKTFTQVYGRVLQIIYIIKSTPGHVYLFTAYTSLNLTGVINHTGASRSHEQRFNDGTEQRYRY